MRNIEDYLSNYYASLKKPTLDAMRFFMNEYNNFDEKMKFIHIAGTNGKGSCVETISNILEKQGYRVGKYLSPHLIKYNERISINGEEIKDDEMWNIIDELEPKIREYNTNNESPVTLFELITTMALLYFYKKKVDFVVLETGLGGLYDCTNIIAKPLVSIITSIGYDHMHILGNSLEEIAYQKAGIIKENSNTVIFSQSNSVDNVFIEICKNKKNNLSILSKSEIENYKYDEKYQYFDFEGYKNVQIILKGKKQIENSMLCIKAMEILNKLGYKVSEKSIREGLKTVIHRGRMEILNKKPLIIYDGAHNGPAIENFKDLVSMYYKQYKKVYVISILKRKDYEKMLKLLLKDKNSEFIFTGGNDEDRFVSYDVLYEIAKKYQKKQKFYKMKLNDAVDYILENEKDKASFFVGSFYVYGDVIKEIKQKNACV